MENQFYEIQLLNTAKLKVDKNTNEVYFADRGDNDVGKYTKEYSKAILESWKIMENSPYKDYKPLYLDPTFKTGQSSTYLEFKAWQDLYLKEPIKGSIAPWTKAEKAYYESLKTKRERYKYLVIRSGLRSSVIDIPYDAYAGVDENGKLINKEYAPLYEEVEANRSNIFLNDFFGGEWGIAAGILGSSWGFVQGAGLTTYGFKARGMQSIFLALQLGVESSFNQLQDALLYWGLSAGIHLNKLRALQIKEFSKNPPYDSYGMLPYLDEMIGVDWVMDLNKTLITDRNNVVLDSKGNIIRALKEKIDKGELKDPRDKDSTKESREEFYTAMRYAIGSYRDRYGQDLPNDWTKEEADFYMNSMLLQAKVASITPPQGYPNAPYYYIPEQIEMLYQKHKLDKRLNPTIPAIYREHFPESLRKEIEDYARKHNIKE